MKKFLGNVVSFFVDDLKWLPTDKEENGSQIKDRGMMEEIDGHVGTR